MRKWIVWICASLFVLFSSTAFAGIVEVDNLEMFERQALRAEGGLVLVDIDNTLIMLKDAVLRPHAAATASKLILEVFDEPGYPYPEHREHDHFLSITFLTAQKQVVDPTSIELVRKLQARNIKTIAFTRAPTGKVGLIPSFEDWRFEELREQGFDFRKSFPALSTLRLAKDDFKPYIPLYKDGILYAANHHKGEVLRAFLEKVKWKPSVVVLLDDNYEYLVDVEKTLNEMGIPFRGYHYVAVEKISVDVDEEVARLQFRTLAEKEVWLSDEEAEHLLRGDTYKNRCVLRVLKDRKHLLNKKRILGSLIKKMISRR